MSFEQPTSFEFIKTGKIKPRGWLSMQLDREVQGYAGHLDEFCAEAGSDIFGKNKIALLQGNHWWNAETEGNWIDGFVRLAFLSGDKAAIKKAENYMQHILETQGDNGYIGIYGTGLRFKRKEKDGEFWAQSRIFSAMLAYSEATGNEKVLAAVKKAALLDIGEYGPYAGNRSYFDGLDIESHGVMLAEPMLRLFDLTGDGRFLDFAVFCYEDFSENYVGFAGADCMLGNLLDVEKPFSSHGAHTCEHLRIPLMLHYYTRKTVYKTAFVNGMVKLKACLGMSGACKCDEYISSPGRNCIPLPELGYEYCGITELLLSLHTAVQITGDTVYADMAENLFFNAAQASRSPDEKTAAYFAADNQYSAMKSVGTRWDYSATHDDAAVCCIPNAVRIVPYQISRMWMKTNDGGLAAMFYGPCFLTEQVNENIIEIDEITEYPFEETITLKIKCEFEQFFPLWLRIPEWSKKAVVSVDGIEEYVSEGSNFFAIKRNWNREATVRITFVPEIETVKAIDGTVAVRRGALLYALQIPHTSVVTKLYDGGYCDIDYLPCEGVYWSYVLSINNAETNKGLLFIREDISGYPWERPNMCIKAKALESTLNYFNLEAMTESHRKFVLYGETSEPVNLTLVPIGCTVLRKTSFNYFIV